jgi:hypothetical protein
LHGRARHIPLPGRPLSGVARGYGVAHSLTEGGVVALWAAAATLVGALPATEAA